jgi:flavin-dependent dehydrogenase
MISAERQINLDGLEAPLKDDKRFVVVGGGPAGCFFAIHLLREARRLNREIKVLVIEKTKNAKPQDHPGWPDGCHFGAGVITPRLNAVMEQCGIDLTAETIESQIDRIWIHEQWKNIPLKVPENMKMYSVFRGSRPSNLKVRPRGFDTLLLKKASEDGAQILGGEVGKIEPSDSGMLRLATRLASGIELSIPASFVAVATGVNAESDNDYRDSEVIRSIQRMNPDFIPAGLRKTILFELQVPRETLRKNLNNQIHLMRYGSQASSLEHIALVPKEEYLTVAAIGKLIDQAVLPEETPKVIRRILELPQLIKILPDIASSPVVCACSPMVTVSVARNPYADGLAIIGDAVGSHLYQDALYAAHLTASRLASVVLREGTDKEALERTYGKTVKRLSWDNRCGNLVFRLMQLAFSKPLLRRIVYQAFATELKIRDKSRRPLGEVLWKIAGADADYRETLRGMLHYGFLRSVMIGGLLITLRNILTEFLLGLKWGAYGRYPTVILKEKRDRLKADISSSLGTVLDESPDFERMYAIKIMAARRRIFEDLGKFGDDRRSYLRLRFVDIARTSGLPNEQNSTIRYKPALLPVALDMHLKRVIPEKVLSYEVSERLVDRGKLIFEISPTKDGNNRLVIYTAFDFKRGRGAGTRIFWGSFRLLFPAFVHDIVWNHALCTIKQEAEGVGGGVS